MNILQIKILVYLILGQLQNEAVSLSSYTVVYSEYRQQPLLIQYKVECREQEYSRPYFNFYTVDSIRTSNGEDYVNNIWDRGHMFPALHSMCDSAKMKESFWYGNCALQHQSLNRGLWRVLEGYEQFLSKTHNVKVIIGVEFKEERRVRGGASIPSGFYKTLYLDGKEFKKYYFPNSKTSGGLENYEIKKAGLK